MTRRLYWPLFHQRFIALLILCLCLGGTDLSASEVGHHIEISRRIFTSSDNSAADSVVLQADTTKQVESIAPSAVDAKKLVSSITLAEIESYLLRYELRAAQELIQEYIKKHFPERDRITPEAQTLEARILRAHRMLQNVERVELLDSVRAPRALVRPGSSFAPGNSWTLKQAVAMINGFVDKRGANRLRTVSQHGGRDVLWESRVGEAWMPHEVQNLLSNTPSQESNPVLAEDGYTIVYAVEDSTTLGGYDLFSRRYVSGKNTIYEPVALGYPFNSPYNDYALLYDEELDRGLLISDRFCPEDSVVVYTFCGRPSALGGKTGAPVVLDDSKGIVATLSLSGLPLPETKGVQQAQAESFYFPLKRGIACRTWKDFSSNQALESYRKARGLESELLKKTAELKKLRAQAHSGKLSEDDSVKLLELINEVASLKESYEHTLVAAKNFEIQQRKL